jgi:GTP:adenosylcobinamide-phosphate guanylyltransferase
VNAIVLAGGAPDAISATQPGAANKAFVNIDGIALVTRVIAALHHAPDVTRIIAVVPSHAIGDPALAGADACRAAGARMIESLAAGIDGLAPDELVLVAAADLPVLSGAGISAFLTAARARDCDLAYAVVAEHDHVAAYPGVPHTWAKLGQGRFCGGGIVALKPRVLPALRTVLDDLGAARKSPLRLAALFGWDILVRFAFGTLSIGVAERRASAILRAPAAAIRCAHADVAVNVDRVSDIALANGLVRAASKIDA